MERIQTQIQEQFRRAFFDGIRAAVASDPPNVEYIVRLYTEIRDRLAAFVRPEGPTYNRIHDQFDVPFFQQLMEHNAFTGESLLGLVNTTFGWVEQLQTPARDAECAAAKQRVMDSGRTMAEIVPAYIRETHHCLDYMEEDMRAFMQHKDHPVVQHALRTMKK